MPVYCVRFIAYTIIIHLSIYFSYDVSLNQAWINFPIQPAIVFILFRSIFGWYYNQRYVAFTWETKWRQRLEFACLATNRMPHFFSIDLLIRKTIQLTILPIMYTHCQHCSHAIILIVQFIL